MKIAKKMFIKILKHLLSGVRWLPVRKSNCQLFSVIFDANAAPSSNDNDNIMSISSRGLL